MRCHDTPENRAKLPKWARLALQKFEADEVYWKDKLSQVAGEKPTKVRVRLTHDIDRWLPEDCEVLFSIGKKEYSVRLDERQD